MSDNSYYEYGKTFTPQKRQNTETEIFGSYWKSWVSNEKYYYECDIGHFSSKFATVEILKSEFESLKSGSLTNKELERRYFQ